jgi:hypothetical protein
MRCLDRQTVENPMHQRYQCGALSPQRFEAGMRGRVSVECDRLRATGVPAEFDNDRVAGICLGVSIRAKRPALSNWDQ